MILSIRKKLPNQDHIFILFINLNQYEAERKQLTSKQSVKNILKLTIDYLMNYSRPHKNIPDFNITLF